VTITETYPEISTPAVRRGRCPGCGGRVTRRRTFAETLSPFNKIDDRSRPKTPAEVRASVATKATAWDPGPEAFRHDRCRTE
jgi:hypothetical protein